MSDDVFGTPPEETLPAETTPAETPPAETPPSEPGADASGDEVKTFMGHPQGLKTLFFTEMWERFSYYGMRALLVLFMTDLIINGGRGMDVTKATAIYGLFTFGVYALALPGGWIADKLLGQPSRTSRRSSLTSIRKAAPVVTPVSRSSTWGSTSAPWPRH